MTVGHFRGLVLVVEILALSKSRSSIWPDETMGSIVQQVFGSLNF